MLRWHRCVPRKVTYLLIKRRYKLTCGNKTELNPPPTPQHTPHTRTQSTNTHRWGEVPPTHPLGISQSLDLLIP